MQKVSKVTFWAVMFYPQAVFYHRLKKGKKSSISETTISGNTAVMFIDA